MPTDTTEAETSPAGDPPGDKRAGGTSKPDDAGAPPADDSKPKKPAKKNDEPIDQPAPKFEKDTRGFFERFIDYWWREEL